MSQGHTTELCSFFCFSQDPQLLHRADEGESVGEWPQVVVTGHTARKVTPVLVLAGHPAPGDDVHEPAEGNRGERQGKLEGCGLAAFLAGSERSIL